MMNGSQPFIKPTILMMPNSPESARITEQGKIWGYDFDPAAKPGLIFRIPDNSRPTIGFRCNSASIEPLNDLDPIMRCTATTASLTLPWESNPRLFDAKESRRTVTRLSGPVLIKLCDANPPFRLGSRSSENGDENNRNNQPSPNALLGKDRYFYVEVAGEVTAQRLSGYTEYQVSGKVIEIYLDGVFPTNNARRLHDQINMARIELARKKAVASMTAYNAQNQ